MQATTLEKVDDAIDWPMLIVLSLAHMLVDAFAGFTTPLLPTFEARFELAAFETGLIMMCVHFTTSFTQPVWGFIGDRYGGVWLILFGPAVALLLVGAVGLAPSYISLLSMVAVAGLGIAAFHPPGTALVSQACRGRRALGVGIFLVSGHFGLFLGPAIAGWIAESHGIDKSWWTIPPGLIVLLVLTCGFRRFSRQPPPVTIPARLFPPRVHRREIGALLALSVLRSFVMLAFAFGMPFWWTSAGFSESQIGFLSGIFPFAGGLAGLFCGSVYRPGQERRWIVTLFLIAVPILWLLPQLQQLYAVAIGVAAAGAALNGSVPIVVVHAQHRMAGSEGMAASLMMGVAWGLGGSLAPPLIRSLQTRIGDSQALLYVGLMLVPAIICATFVGRPAATDPEQADVTN